MLLIKVFGLITVFSVCTAAGFIKSASINKRANKLSDFYRSICSLAERIRISSDEILRLIEICFDKSLCSISENRIIVDESYLSADDIRLLTELFSGLGMGDSISEYNRINSYLRLIKIQCEKAGSDTAQLCKLYKSLGALGGIFICIFLL